MSATGRKTRQVAIPGLGYERHADDFFATPAWCVEAMLNSLAPMMRGRGLVVEPSCGDGAILDVLRAHGFGVVDGAGLVGIELDTDRALVAAEKGHNVGNCDFMEWTPIPDVGWFVANPPFKHAEEFLRRCLELLPPGGAATFLLRLGFLASARRAPLYVPGVGFAHLGVLSRRPSFTGKGTDAADYAWFTFVKGHTVPAVIEHVELTT